MKNGMNALCKWTQFSSSGKDWQMMEEKNESKNEWKWLALAVHASLRRPTGDQRRNGDADPLRNWPRLMDFRNTRLMVAVSSQSDPFDGGCVQSVWPNPSSFSASEFVGFTEQQHAHVFTLCTSSTTMESLLNRILEWFQFALLEAFPVDLFGIILRTQTSLWTRATDSPKLIHI